MDQKYAHSRISSLYSMLFLFMAVLSVLLLITSCEAPGQSTTSRDTAGNQQPTSVPSSPRTFLGSGTSLTPDQCIFMVNAQIGWFLSANNMTHLFRTVDGGKSWKQVQIPQDLSKKNFWVSVFDADMVLLQPFQDERDFKPSASFYRTIDAGASWQHWNWPPMTLETDKGGGVSRSWTFLDHMHGWVMTPSPSPEFDGSPPPLGKQMLYRTVDGGKNWQPVAHLPLQYGGESLTFLDAQTGWLLTSAKVSGQSNSTPSHAFSDVLYVTHDGGQSWHQSSVLPLPAYRNPQATLHLTFFSQREGYFLYIDDDGRLYLFMTQDEGTTWRKGAALPEDVEIKGPVGVIDATHFNDLSFLYTFTKGQWVKTSNPVPVPHGTVPVVDFASSQTGVAVGATSTYRTEDGGKHWKKVGTLPEKAS